MLDPFAIYSDTRPMNAGEALPVARYINKLARAHRASWSSTPTAQVRTGLALFLAIANAGASRHLNAMGDLLDAHGVSNEVSDRTLDSPFESGEITDQIVDKLARLVAKDQALRVSLCRQGWREAVQRWLREAANLPGRTGLLAKEALAATA